MKNKKARAYIEGDCWKQN